MNEGGGFVFGDRVRIGALGRECGIRSRSWGVAGTVIGWSRKTNPRGDLVTVRWDSAATTSTISAAFLEADDASPVLLIPEHE